MYQNRHGIPSSGLAGGKQTCFCPVAYVRISAHLCTPELLPLRSFVCAFQAALRVTWPFAFPRPSVSVLVSVAQFDVEAFNKNAEELVRLQEKLQVREWRPMR